MAKKNKIAIFILILIFISLVTLPFILQGGKTQKVTLTDVKHENLTSTLSYTGILDSENTVNITLVEQFFTEEVFVKNGQKVKKDDILAKGYSVSMTGQKGNNKEFKAECDGIISNLSLKKNSVSQPGQPLITIKDILQPKVTIKANQQDVKKLKIGQNANFILDNYKFSGSISFVSSNVETVISQMGSTNSINVEINFDNLNGESQIEGLDKDITLSDLFVSGYEVDVEIITDSKENVLSIPISTIKSDKNGDYCFIVTNENIAVKKYVTLGIVSDSKYEILKGLEIDESVIINPNSKLKDGDVVISI